MRMLPGVSGDASFSPDSTYRYWLSRTWESVEDKRYVVWVLLNPSTASAETDDPTVRTCQRLSRLWGFSGTVVVNLFALRSTDPKALLRHRDPVGPDNDAAIATAVIDDNAGLVVAAWGAYGSLRNRGLLVEVMFERLGVRAMRLGPVLRGGHPKHPLYTPDDVKLEVHCG